jgi:hypothetical protein
MLAPDLASTEQALSNFVTVMKAIGTYNMALTTVNLGPIDVEGSSYDLFANFPVLKANIVAAQQHANTFMELNAFLTVLIGVDNYNSAFQDQSGEILETLAAAGQNPNGQPTPAQQQSLTANLQSLLSALTTQQQSVQGLIGPAQTFADQLTTDHANLSGGEQPISAAISSINQWVQDEIMKVIGGIGGQGLADLIAQIGSQINSGLNNLLSNLETLVSENETASQAMSGVLTVWETLVAKYSDVISNLQQAGGGGILEAGDVRAAQSAWTQIDQYVLTLV